MSQRRRKLIEMAPWPARALERLEVRCCYAGSGGCTARRSIETGSPVLAWLVSAARGWRHCVPWRR